MPLHDICWFFGWIMVGKEKKCLHLPKKVLRKYDYILTIHRSPTTIGALEQEDVVVAF